MKHNRLDTEYASRFARIALGHVAKEYPHKLDHVLDGDRDLLAPRTLHPVFFGSFDWHSCVHSWWMLLTLRRLFPMNAESAAIEELASETFTPPKIEAELAYLDRPSSRGFERPYGWAWLLYLHLEAVRHMDRQWGVLLEPLAVAFARRLREYLSILTYPIRVGTHYNTAFSLVLASDWADEFDPVLKDVIRDRSRIWFGADKDPQAWEPSGDEFLSPTLIEALCMTRVLPKPDADDWIAAFLPRVRSKEPRTLFEPAMVSDRSDGKIAHLDGLNLSRAWCWQNLMTFFAPEESRHAAKAAEDHLTAAMPHIAGDYMGEHWLATFALLALRPPAGSSG